MSRARKIATSLLATLLLTASLALPAAAQDRPAEAKAWLEATVDEFLALFRDPGLSSGQRLERVEAIALERFDFDRMTKLVLGKNRRKLSEAQQGEFRDEFKQHISLTYGRSIDDYSDESVEIVNAIEERNGDVTVKTKIVGGAANDVTVDYRLRSKDGAPWRVIDVIIEGVSMVQNFRSQIQEIVSSKGADQLIAILRKKNERDSEAPPPGGSE